jgi:uncharacterized Fe-S center protein
MSKVYFIDFRTTSQLNMLQKLKMLMKETGFENIDFQKKLTALKIHFGEPGNLSYIRPNYAAVIAKYVQELGGSPFLTDANTLYKGRRSNAVDHLQSAMENGFSPLTTGCNIIIADGLKGTDYKEIEINQKYCKTAKIATAIANSDVLVSINHFKGHEMAGFGGALKNIGMGSGAIGGKLEMHSDSQPSVVRDNCTGCEVCVHNCAHDAIKLDTENKASIDYQKCTGCGQCVAVCQYGAPQAIGEAIHMQEKMMDYAYAVLRNKPSFHINFIMDVSPLCDCWNHNDVPIVPNIGIAASIDPVALDRACADMVNNAPIHKNSVIGNHFQSDKDRFHLAAPGIDWHVGLNYAEFIGLGVQKYELIKL